MKLKKQNRDKDRKINQLQTTGKITKNMIGDQDTLSSRPALMPFYDELQEQKDRQLELKEFHHAQQQACVYCGKIKDCVCTEVHYCPSCPGVALVNKPVCGIRRCPRCKYTVAIKKEYT